MDVALGTERVPVTRPRGHLAFVVPLLVAAGAGLTIGATPQTAVLLTAAVVSALVLTVRLEWAALAVIGTAVFGDYLDRLSPWVDEWLVLLLVIAWAVRRAHGPLHEHRLLTTTVPAGIFAAVLAASVALHPNGYAGGVVVGRYVQLLVVLLVLADTLAGPLAPRRAARVYVWSCVLAAACGIVTAIVSEPHRVVGPLALSDDLAFSLLAAVALLGTVRTRTQPMWWLWAATAMLLVALVGTRSRVTILALAFMLVVSVGTRLLSLRYAGALVVLVATCIAFVLAVVPHPVGHAISDPQRYAETKIQERNDVRREAFAVTRDHPVLGLGPASFALFNQDYRDADQEPTDLDLDIAYSSVLEVSAELGVLGVGALLAVFLVPGVAARRRWRRDRSGLAAVTLLALGGLLVAAALESVQYLLPLWFVAAMAAALGHQARPRLPVFGDNSSGQVPTRK
jgi:putative inorganic carbon (HCO3(-)) transporter